MDRKEKLRKMSAVQAFCRENVIEEKELEFLFRECAFATTPFPYDILYADGTVSNMPDLTKNPVAMKIRVNGESNEYFCWLSLTTTGLTQMNYAEACRYVDTLPPVNGKKWRLADHNELSFLLERHSPVLEGVCNLKRFFELPALWKIEKNDPDGRFVYIGTNTGGLYSPIFPGMTISFSDDCLCYWWPVCEV